MKQNDIHVDIESHDVVLVYKGNAIAKFSLDKEAHALVQIDGYAIPVNKESKPFFTLYLPLGTKP